MKFASNAQAVPKIIPPSTSENQCTHKYMRENEIKTAQISATVPHFLLWQNIATANANETAECPDGNDQSCGGIKIFSFQKDWSGLVLITIFFKIKLHETKSKTIEMAQVVPSFLVGLYAMKKRVQIINNIPYSASNVK